MGTSYPLSDLNLSDDELTSLAIAIRSIRSASSFDTLRVMGGKAGPNLLTTSGSLSRFEGSVHGAIKLASVTSSPAEDQSHPIFSWYVPVKELVGNIPSGSIIRAYIPSTGTGTPQIQIGAVVPIAYTVSGDAVLLCQVGWGT